MLALAAPAVLGLALRLGASQNMTPVLMAVQDAPVPFKGSDGRVHLVYELWMTNASSANVSVQKVDVIGTGRRSRRSMPQQWLRVCNLWASANRQQASQRARRPCFL